MNICPDCIGELFETVTERGSFWVCSKCGGRVETEASLHQWKGEAFTKSLFSQVSQTFGAGRCPCPLCSSYAMEVNVTEGGNSVKLKVCPTCHAVWVGREACQKLQLDVNAAPKPAIPAPAPQPLRASQSQMPPSPVTITSTPVQAAAKQNPDKIVLTQEQQERLAAVLSQTTASKMERRFNQSKPSILAHILQTALLLCGIPVKIVKKRR